MFQLHAICCDCHIKSRGVAGILNDQDWLLNQTAYKSIPSPSSWFMGFTMASMLCSSARSFLEHLPGPSPPILPRVRCSVLALQWVTAYPQRKFACRSDLTPLLMVHNQHLAQPPYTLLHVVVLGCYAPDLAFMGLYSDHRDHNCCSLSP